MSYASSSVCDVLFDNICTAIMHDLIHERCLKFEVVFPTFVVISMRFKQSRVISNLSLLITTCSKEVRTAGICIVGAKL